MSVTESVSGSMPSSIIAARTKKLTEAQLKSVEDFTLRHNWQTLEDLCAEVRRCWELIEFLEEEARVAGERDTI